MKKCRARLQSREKAGNFKLLLSAGSRWLWREADFVKRSLGAATDLFSPRTRLGTCAISLSTKIYLKSLLFLSFLPKTAKSSIFAMETSRASKRSRTQLNVRGKKIAIEGNIATGKSTFIRMLEEKSVEWSVVPEPVARWTNISTGDGEEPTMSQQSGGNLLQMFYDDISRWSYTFQSYALLSRMRLQRKGLPVELQDAKNPVQFFERSLQSDRYIFALNCYESGVMSETEWNIYQDWSTYLLRSLGELKLDGIIYLRADPEVCYSRMQKRGRNEEKGVSLDYLTCLHQKHEAWLYNNEVQMDETLVGVPILTIDCNEEFVDNHKRQQEMLDKVVEFVGVDCAHNDSGLDSNNVSSNSDESSDIEY